MTFPASASIPVPAPVHSPETYATFLRQQLPLQQASVASYPLGAEQVWLKKAGPPHGMWRYRVLGALAGALQLAALRPVPNLGGTVAIATEVRRLRELRARGLRVPEVLAVQPDGFLMQHLGASGSLVDEMNAQRSDPQAVLDLWQQGLQALAQVHAADTCLSQAFARNMVRCPDGVIGFIDFEEDPAAALPLAHCQARDALHYVHSCALYLREGGVLDAGHALWTAWLRQASPAMQAALTTNVARLGWLRILPQSRRLGRDLQRVRAGYDLLAWNPE